MKKYYFLLLAFSTICPTNAQIINFTDSVLKTELLEAGPFNSTARDANMNAIKIDINNDGNIQVSEALNVYLLNLGGDGIHNLVGIEHFANLHRLNCYVNPLAEVDVSALTQLEYLDCHHSNGGITSVNVSGLTNLKEIICYGNEITSLDLSGLPNLETVLCYSNDLTSLLLTGSTNLKTLQCGSNGNLTSLNLAGMTKLETLDCGDNYLPGLITTDLIALKSFTSYGLGMTILDLSGLTNLITVDCKYGTLTTLNVSGCASLETLVCNQNALTSINLAGATGLKSINCDTNQIVSLDVSGLPLLETLTCNYNALTSLTLIGANNLKEINCAGNNLTMLSAAGMSNLEYLQVMNNELQEINVAGCTSLYNLTCPENLLAEINVSECTALESLWCYGNPPLASIFMKNGSNEELYAFTNPNLHYICADESEAEGILNSLGNYIGFTYCEVNSYCTLIPGGVSYTLNATSRVEIGGSCQPTNPIVPYLNYALSNGIVSANVISGGNGILAVPVGAGTHTITPMLENPSYFSVNPSVASVTFPSNPNPFQEFCIVPNGSHQDLEIFILPISPARPGFDATYKIVYKNKGTVVLSGSFTLNFEDDVLDLVSSMPMHTTGTYNSLNWDYVDIQPQEFREVFLTFNVNTPMEIPGVSIGDQLDFTVAINPVSGDEIPQDNDFGLKQIVVGSFDPNDKTCAEGESITTDMVGEYIHYVIRFENTGTYPAENIIVKDLIDISKFDVATLIPLSGSHPFETRIPNSNKVEFIFENINLPFDEANNDGYVAFKIKTKPTLVIGDTFSNTASIYFDYNFPIVTNTASTVIQVLGTPDFEFSDYFTLYPNPAQDIMNIAVANTIEIKSISIYNMLGQLVLAIPNAQAVSAIDVSDLKPGNYCIKIDSDMGSSAAQFLKD